MDFYSPTGELHHIPGGAMIALGLTVIGLLIYALFRNRDSWYN